MPLIQKVVDQSFGPQSHPKGPRLQTGMKSVAEPRDRRKVAQSRREAGQSVLWMSSAALWVTRHKEARNHGEYVSNPAAAEFQWLSGKKRKENEADIKMGAASQVQG